VPRRAGECREAALAWQEWLDAADAWVEAETARREAESPYFRAPPSHPPGMKPPGSPPPRRPRALRAVGFDDPAQGVALIAGLDEHLALPILRALADPAGQPSAPVLHAASGALGSAGRL